jgi:DNA-directed RNA polymerase specialized sigma subunit
MTIKEELMQYRFKLKKVDEALEDYERFKARAEKMTAIFSDVVARTNITSDKVGDNAVKMADIEKEYIQRWLDAENEKNALLDKLTCIDEPYRTILALRYIHNKNFESIAYDIGYSYKQTLRLHGQALQIVKDKNNVRQCH